MKKSLFCFLTFLSLISYSFGQTNPEVVVPAFDDEYSRTVKLLESGQTDIDYRKFRESFLESEQFKKASLTEFSDLEKKMYAQMKAEEYTEIIKTTKAMLSIDYTSMIAHKILRQTYKILGDTANAKKYKEIQFGLLNSIVKNGDGKTCETAWPVIQISEEYFILDMLDAELLEQSVDNKNGLCDRMDVKTEKGKRTYYFDVVKVFEGYEKLGIK